MNTNMTGFRWFSKSLRLFALDQSSLSIAGVNGGGGGYDLVMSAPNWDANDNLTRSTYKKKGGCNIDRICSCRNWPGNYNLTRSISTPLIQSIYKR